MIPRRAKPQSHNSEAPTIEWIGGIVSMPAYVTGEGEPYRPEAFLWIGADGAILGSQVARPGESVFVAGESLQEAMDRPLIGAAHRPTRVRVASDEVARVLRGSHPGIEVVCRPTPEIDAIATDMWETMGREGPDRQSYIPRDGDADAMRPFFKAAAALFRAKPWKVVPDDESLFSVTIEPLGVRDAAMSIIGQLGQEFGLILFRDIEGFEDYADAPDVVQLRGRGEMPPHFAMTFERGTDLAAELREEVAEHRWEVAGRNAYPWMVVVDQDLVARPPTGREVLMAETIAVALVSVLVEKKALIEAWRGARPVTRTVPVMTHQGEIEVTLSAPYMRTLEFDPSGDILADLAALARDVDEIDFEARRTLEDELIRRFAASPEAKDLEDISACRFVMDLAADYCGQTIATVDGTDLDEILFDLIPRKVSIEASEAPRIVHELGAFFTFLKREFGHPKAGSCLQTLDGNAVRTLETALSDTSKFGMAKSLFMAGRDAGFDMQSREGIEAWMESVRGMPLPPSIPVPWPGASQPSSGKVARKAAKAKKNKRKAARKTRKKNR